MLAVTPELHCCSQPSDALFAALLPEQLVPAVIFKVNFELSCAWAIHVVVKVQTLRPPGAPKWARQQPNTLTRQHGWRLHVQVVSCWQKLLWWVLIKFYCILYLTAYKCDLLVLNFYIIMDKLCRRTNKASPHQVLWCGLPLAQCRRWEWALSSAPSLHRCPACPDCNHTSCLQSHSVPGDPMPMTLQRTIN